MAIANDISKGKVIQDKNGKIWKVSETSHVKPGKGGAFIQIVAFGIGPENRGIKLQERFRSTENVNFARVEEKTYSFLYEDGDLITIMDADSYEQVEIQRSLFEGKDVFLQEGLEVKIELCEEEPLIAKVPEKVKLKVVEADAVVKGQTAAGSNKPAVLENGLKIMVPPFIKSGDELVVRTTSDVAEYIERVKN